MRWPVVGAVLVLLAACTSPVGQSELAARVATATVDGWLEAGLPELSAGCMEDSFSVHFPVTVDDYYELCPPKSTGCLIAWAAVVKPGLPETEVEPLLVHELLHELSRCTLERGYDYDHEEGRVWAPGEHSAEVIASASLR